MSEQVAATTIRVVVGDEAVYEGSAGAVPRVGENIVHDGETVGIESVVWDFSGNEGVVTVVLGIGARPYTF
jgi:hypothetical protein